MATSADFANWLRNNQDKRGTPDYRTVLQAYQETALAELRAAQPPAPAAPAAKPASGFLPALRAGATELGGGISALLGKVGLKDEATAQAEYDAAQKRAREIFAPTEAGWTEAPGTKLLELLGGSVPYMAAPLAAGAAAAALPLTGPAALATTLGAAGLTSATQFTATNLSRQMEEGKKLAETDLGNAALAAVPQAALDTLSMRMIPGIGRIFGQAGIKVTAETAKEIAEQGLKKTLIDYTAATGKTMGAEGLTEAAQQVLERAQAGLSLTDPKAREEYFDSFLGGAVLGGTLAVPGRYYERGKAQGEARTLLEGQEAEQRKAARAATEAERKTPEYLETRYDAYQKLSTEIAALEAQLKKGTKEAPLSQEDKDANAVIQQQLGPLKDQEKAARKEFIAAGGPQAIAKLRAGQLELTPPPGRVSEPPPTEAAPEAPEVARPRYEQEVRRLTGLLEQQRGQLVAAETPEDAVRIAEQTQRTKTALDSAQDALSKLPAAPDTAALQEELKKLQKRFDEAKANADQDKVLGYGKQLLELKKQLQEVAPTAQLDLFAPEAIAAEQTRRDALGEEMAVGRETAGYERTQAEIEQQAAREAAARRAAVDAELTAEGTAEREAMSELGQRLAQQQRGREMARVRIAPQLALFPEARERVEQEAVGSEDTVVRRREQALPETPQVDVRAQPLLTQRIAAMADRVLAAPGVDEGTKDVVRQMQADLPAFLRQANPQPTAAWLYRTLTTGRADPADTARARDVLRTLEEAKLSETEERTQYAGRALTPQEREAVRGTSLEGRQGVLTREPTGDVRRAVQQELPEMPEPRATAFNTYEEFERYLASQTPLMVDAQGRIALSVARLQRELAPLREQAAELRKQEADLKQKAAALKEKTGADRAAAQALVDESQFSLNIARNALENRIERVIAARAAAVQKYSDSLTDGIRVLLDIADGVKQFDAEIAAREPVQVSSIQRRREALETRRAEQQEKLSTITEAAEKAKVEADLQRIEKRLSALPKGYLFDSATVLSGDLPGYTAAREAEKKVEKALDEWAAAQTNMRDVVQRNVGADWSDSSTALGEYLVAKKRVDAAGKTVWNAKNELRKLAKDRKGVTPLPDAAFGDFLVKQAELAAKLDVELKRISGLSKYVKGIAKNADVDVYLKQRDAAQAALSKALRALPEGGDVGALLRNHMKPLEDAKTALADKLSTYSGTAEQIAAFDKAQADLRAAETLLAEVAAATRPDDAQAEQLLAAAKTAAAQAGGLESSVASRLAAAKARAEARTRVAPTPAETTLAQREAADAAKRRAEQASLEAGERSGVMVFFEKNKEDIMEDTNYIKLVAQTYDSSLSMPERMQAATEADKYMQEKQAKLEARAEKTSAVSALHEENLKKARAKLAELQGLRGKKRTEKTAAKLEDTIKKQEAVIAGHQAKLNKSLTGTKITRMSRADLKAVREQANAEISRTRVAGERLGVAEGTQQRAIGPATRPEVTPPQTLRTGTEESIAGETTTPSKNRIQEARGVRQRDVAIGKKEIAEANLIAAENAVETAKTPSEKRLAEAKLAVAELRYEIAAKGDSNTRAQQLSEAEGEVQRLLRVGMAPVERTPLTASEEAEIAKELEETPEVESAQTTEQKVDSFLKSLKKITKPSKKEKGLRAFGEVDVDIKKGIFPAPNKSIYISLIRNNGAEGKGAASTVLKKLMALADTHGVTLTLQPEQVGTKGLSTEQLEAWYARSGFKSWDGGMYREPKKQGETVEELTYEAPEIEILGGAREEAFFSRGPVATPSTTDSVRTELKKTFPDLGRVQIYDSVDALVAANPQYKGKIPADARGFVDSAGNKAFLIAENINQGQALSVLLHEVGAHVGLKSMLGDAQYSALVNAVKSWEKRTDNSPEARVAQAARARVEAAETPASQVNDELLAYAVEEAVNAGVKPMETRSTLGRWLSQVAALFRRALQKFGLPPKALDAQGLVDMAFGAAKMEMRGQAAPAAEARTEPGEIRFSRNLPTAARVANQIVGEQKGWLAKLKDNFLGQGFRMQFVDKYSSVEEVLKRGRADPTKAMQAMYYLRMVDQQMHFTSQAITDGVPERREIIRRDGTKEYLIEAKPGANLKQAYDILKRKDVVKETGSADASNKLATLYMAAIRGERVGYDTLNFGRVWAQGEIKRIENELKSPKLSAEQRTVLTKRMNRLESRLDSMPTPEDFKAAKAEIDANPVLRDAFSEVRDIYNQYNRDLINFNVQTGALSKEQANKLLQENDYIPYYRIRDGVAELMIGKETPIRIGNLKDSPHLQELVGGDEPIMDFIASSVQNTSMLINMAMHNIAMKNLMFEFKDLGLATIGKVKNNNAPKGAVTFKLDGVEHFAVVDTEALGISSELLVKGLAGIPTMFPAFVRVMGAPARFLRRMIVASPLYMARQLFRDSLAASIASGANTVPILGALKQIGKTDVLERRGITGGQVFTGMPEDQARMIKAMQAGKLSITNGLAYLEGKAAQVDALTRRAQYDSYIQQGLSEMEATYMALESMNFSRRGLSPSLHMASTLIPFFNAQIQGLDVLYRSFTGQMPMNERLEVRKKLITRGAMLALLSFAYAMAMQDDEAYKNAKPEEKYGNWFVSLPGVEQPLRLPIPFELGYVFKALPEALVNILSNEEGGEEAFKALKHIVQQMIPGASSYFIPAGVKPLAEVGFGVSAYTGRDIESAREQQVEPAYRARESTTELAKTVGELTGFSPIKLEFLISGYTGQMGMALIAALSAPFAGTGEGPAPATKRPSDLPLIGTLFQPKDASGIIDLVYERMNKVRQVQETYKRLIDENKPEQAKRYAEEKADELSLASVAGAFRQQMGEITKFEREVRASNLTPDRKRAELDRARQAKIDLSKRVQALSGRTAPQAARP